MNYADLMGTANELPNMGYRVVENAWPAHGRVTYIHDDDASPKHVAKLIKQLEDWGWKRHPRKLRVLQHHHRHMLTASGANHHRSQPVDGYEIELEPGGSEVTGHYAHVLYPNAIPAARGDTKKINDELQGRLMWHIENIDNLIGRVSKQQAIILLHMLSDQIDDRVERLSQEIGDVEFDEEITADDLWILHLVTGIK